MHDTIDIFRNETTHPQGWGNMCRVVIPRPASPPRPLLLRLVLLAVWLRSYLRDKYTLLAFVAWRLKNRRAIATQCRAVPSLTGGPDLHGWRAPVKIGMAFVAHEGEVSIVPQLHNDRAHGSSAKRCIAERERLGRRLAYRYPSTIIRLDAASGWIISTAGNLSRLFGAS